MASSPGTMKPQFFVQLFKRHALEPCLHPGANINLSRIFLKSHSNKKGNSPTSCFLATLLVGWFVLSMSSNCQAPGSYSLFSDNLRKDTCHALSVFMSLLWPLPQ